MVWYHGSHIRAEVIVSVGWTLVDWFRADTVLEASQGSHQWPACKPACVAERVYGITARVDKAPADSGHPVFFACLFLLCHGSADGYDRCCRLRRKGVASGGT